MRKVVLLVLMQILSSQLWAQDLQSRLEAMAAQHQGKIAFFAKDIKTGATVGLDPDRPVATASVIKVAVMVEAFYEIKAG